MEFKKEQVRLLEENRVYLVLQNVKDKYKNIATQSSCISHIKRMYLDDDKHRTPEYFVILKKALSICSNYRKELLDFSSRPLYDQYKIQKMINIGNVQYSPEADEIIENIPLYNIGIIECLKLSPTDMKQVRKIQSKALHDKHHNIKIVDGDKLMASVLPKLLSANIKEVIFAVLLATGRRQNELMKGILTEIEDDPYMVTFSGQSKTGLDIKRPPYNIPLLAHSHIVILAWNRSKLYFENVKNNRKFKDKIRNVARWIKKNPQYEIENIHQLRSIYACIVCQLFPTNKMSNMAHISNVLGEASINIAAHYNSTKIINLSGLFKF